MTARVQPAEPALHSFASALYPICRSITGNGVRETLAMVGAQIPLRIEQVPSGSPVYDWEVPQEWNIENAWVADSAGKPVIEFERHNLHLVSYSEPVRTSLELDALKQHLHSIPDRPDWIPYRTSYYRRSWGFCMRHRDLVALQPGRYDVRVDSTLADGALTYGEFFLPGATSREVLLFTHVCHPSLANDNASGIAVATELAKWLSGTSRRFSYRIVFAPGTIGSLCWLKNNESRLNKVQHGLVMCLLGDPSPLTYKKSRRGDCEIDQVVAYVLRHTDPAGAVIPFEPYGYDERQLCSPGFDLPVGRLTRSVNSGYPQYHSSADDMDLISEGQLRRSLEALQNIVTTLESNRRYLNVLPKGEPRLGKRGLYGSVGGRSPADSERALLWILNQSDGKPSLLDIAETSGLPFSALADGAERLAAAQLIQPHAHAEAAGGRESSNFGSSKAEPAEAQDE